MKKRNNMLEEKSSLNPKFEKYLGLRPVSNIVKSMQKKDGILGKEGLYTPTEQAVRQQPFVNSNVNYANKDNKIQNQKKQDYKNNILLVRKNETFNDIINKQWERVKSEHSLDYQPNALKALEKDYKRITMEWILKNYKSIKPGDKIKFPNTSDENIYKNLYNNADKIN